MNYRYTNKYVRKGASVRELTGGKGRPKVLC